MAMDVARSVAPNPVKELGFVCPKCRAPFDPEHGADRCTYCGFQVTRFDGIINFVPMSEVDEWQDFFENEASGPDGDTTAAVAYQYPIQHRYIVSAFRRLFGNVPAEASVLDVGCGNGLFWKAILGLHPAVGVDYSRGMCRLARARGMQVYQADGRALPFADAQFDLVYSAEIVQYVDDLPSFMAELHRLCRPGGRIVVSTISGSSMLRRLNRWIRRGFSRQDTSTHSVFRLRSATEMITAGQSSRLQFARICRTHFPFPLLQCSANPRYFFEPIATNLIVEFIKPLT